MLLYYMQSSEDMQHPYYMAFQNLQNLLPDLLAPHCLFTYIFMISHIHLMKQIFWLSVR